MSAASLAGLLGIMSFSYSDLFCNHDLTIALTACFVIFHVPATTEIYPLSRHKKRE